jgi:hypothetical protein
MKFPADHPRRPEAAAKPVPPYNHWRHDRAACHDPQVKLTTDAEAVRTADGTPIVTTPTTLRLTADGEETSFLRQERFEAVFYLDGLFLFEEEMGFLPLTWELKPELVTPGRHIVSVMVRGYGGHFGTASLSVAGPEGKDAADKAPTPKSTNLPSTGLPRRP